MSIRFGDGLVADKQTSSNTSSQTDDDENIVAPRTCTIKIKRKNTYPAMIFWEPVQEVKFPPLL